MASWILLIVVLVVLIVLLTAVFSTAFGRGEATEPLPSTAQLNEENLAAIEEGNLWDVSFDVVPRGYNQAQVDAVVEYLYDQLQLARRALEETGAPAEERTLHE